MVELTEFQKRRQENIKRNNDLLKKLHLGGAASRIKREAGVDDTHRTVVKKKKSPSVSRGRSASPKVAPVATRRSMRLRGEKVDNVGIPNVSDTQLMKMSLDGTSGSSVNDKELVDEIKDTPVIGDVKLSDLIKDEKEENLIEKFKSFANKNFSSGDFFEEIRKRQMENKAPELQKLQDDFDLQLYDVFQPNEIKLVYERITATYFHPSLDKKLIVAGDTSGNIGLWNVRDEPLSENGEDQMVEPDITKVKFFTKNVGKIDCFTSDTSKLLTASYDGSLRSIDLNSLQSNDILTLRNEYDDPLGISDFQFSYENPNVLLMTTLSGEFVNIDLREKIGEQISSNLRRLSDKKIGSFSINPNRPYEIATGSLDRTLKIWDIRKLVKKPEWSQYEDYDSCEIVSVYDSRLSVSAVSYSPTDNTLVCNGYDDTIRLFDVGSDNLPDDLQPKLTLKHNCQSGRWTSILKARFKQDQDVFAIANMKRAIDIYDSQGQQLAHLPTATVPAVISWHPLRNWIAGGNSSGKIFLFTDETVKKEEEE
ncbi:hypothetical protein Kpol_530p43 [Vanderwaltozyma polyspora DSM 70294]|uniref:DNA damage-binding protein CMR1 n=1 Tax=Vanderwaltozyma polyspora (strain ATCC 22028 / DSM 70294 / BCRC 21397 / CBS 2163 / NBRC 10782 / NRRL Y-8283 / UCD 57-17) TaxID=436907 RepID=CMR1_VANPO|nr:uncharacterized protein Kpol_530p43 [Vanderwaltozyma polyspora DSM 70294]A7TL17.1 RecName: Full=DNA damage-binding protein CMR1 [Vanderwaltozyma polyspora DSM 70294]EDO17073.1 hypothetical protein Kpol_530p43 [Vanderwaltozyma polyspora DSM 70294]